MRIDNHDQSLAGNCLVAMPSITERAFRKAVILICAHSPAGAIGLLINRPAMNMTLRQLLAEYGLPLPPIRPSVPLHVGGPADIDRAFVLHSCEYHLPKHTHVVSDEISLTAERGILRDMGASRGPDRAFVALGYCGWGPCQLEREVQDGRWLTTASDGQMVFDTPSPQRWHAAMSGMGVATFGLSQQFGHA
ncbi:YqgE/AlgH family protein [Jannaschia sp. 2305UL9-9]|uniref:YqgE/AlgH family protein n=1 Tax=Jannaschia sp. 2305UL9-9 TaxID=3121638 RepID=UPI00352975B0